jgi:hypothetical protein
LWIICESVYKLSVIPHRQQAGSCAVESLFTEAPAIRHDFDVFEKFPDGSTLWRACIAGRYETHRKMQELAEHSEN